MARIGASETGKEQVLIMDPETIIGFLILIPIILALGAAVVWFSIMVFGFIFMIAFKLAMLALGIGFVFVVMVFLTTGHMPW